MSSSASWRTWTFYHPVKLVQEVNANLAEVDATKLQQIPSSNETPWRIKLWCDGLIPGSKLNADNQGNLLEADGSWFIPVVVRQNVYNDVEGGWSALLRILLRYLLFGPSNFTTGDVMLRCGVAFCGQLQAVLQLQVYRVSELERGAMHNNVFKKDAGMSDAAVNFVEITCTDPAQLRQVCKYRQSAGREKNLHWSTKLANLITAAGFCCTEHGLLADGNMIGCTLCVKMGCSALWLVSKNITDAIGDSECESLVFQFPTGDSCIVRVHEETQREASDGN